MQRTPRSKKLGVDLTKPINKEEIMDDSCFGKMWDMSTHECLQCADRDICGILFKDKVDKKAKNLEKKIGSKYLDEADFENMTDKKLKSFIKSGETTIQELIKEGCKLSNCDDIPAVKTYLKEWIKSTNVSIKSGVVWVN